MTSAPGHPSRHRSTSVEQTEALAAHLGRCLAAGDVVLLHGDLGAGKTAFVRGLAAGLGADPDEVSSPTFTLMQEYRGRLPLRHLDLYRIASPEEADDLGLDEAAAGAVLAVEWPERLGAPWPGAWRVELTVVDEETRDVRVSPPVARAFDYSTR